MSASHDVVVSWAQQSPIELEPAIYTEDLPQLVFHYGKVTGHFEDDDFIIDSTPAPYLTIGTKEYPLKKLHFHAPSEHTINGSRKECEIHFVHADPDFPSKSPSLFFVVGVFVDLLDQKSPKKAKSGFEPYFKAVASGKNSLVANSSGKPETVDLTRLIPGSDHWNDYWRYEGSLTTPSFFKRDGEFQVYPPFAELVSWFVLKKEIQSPSLAALRIIGTKQKPRGRQPRNRRFVLRNFPGGGGGNG